MPFTASPTRRLSASPAFQQLSKSFRRSMLAANKSPRAVETYLEALRLFGEYLGTSRTWHEQSNTQREPN